MTQEEAVEEILDGRPYATCVPCKGDGTVRTSSLGGAICKNCQGSGKWLRGDYVTACRVLGIDPPTKPESQWHSTFGKLTPEEFKKMLSNFSNSPLMKVPYEAEAAAWEEAAKFSPLSVNTEDVIESLRYAMRSPDRLYNTKRFKL